MTTHFELFCLVDPLIIVLNTHYDLSSMGCSINLLNSASKYFRKYSRKILMKHFFIKPTNNFGRWVYLFNSLDLLFAFFIKLLELLKPKLRLFNLSQRDFSPTSARLSV